MQCIPAFLNINARHDATLVWFKQEFHLCVT